MRYRTVGTRPARVDAAAKLAGTAVFGPDVDLPHAVPGAILRSPHAHARVLRIDTSRAEALPGVLAVVTSHDLPRPVPQDADLRRLRDNTLAGAKVLYHGHPVVGIAARTRLLAAEALELIRVEYEPLEPVLDVSRAMADGAPILDEALRTESSRPMPDRPTNIASSFSYQRGDPDEGFAGADVVVERVFETATVHQGHIEPHAGTAAWSDDGSLTVHCTTQGAFDTRAHLHRLLDIPEARIRVIPTEVGGAFGAKNTSYVEAVAALLARKANRPVKMVMTQREVLLATGPTSGSWIRAKIGVGGDGRFLAVEAELRFEAGAYPAGWVAGAAANMFAAYDIPNGRIEGYEVLVNKPKTGSYRAPGTTQSVFAAETLVDEAAERLGMDPFELRRRNRAREGTVRLEGMPHASMGSTEVLKAAMEHAHYLSALPRACGPLRYGRGVAFAYWGNWGARSSVTLSVNFDGSVDLLSGSVDITGTRTSVAMQAAETLGIALERITSRVGDTSSTGYTDTSAGSRTTMATGVAAVEAAKDVISQMRARTAALWKITADEVSYRDGTLTRTDTGETMGFAEAASRLPATGGALRGRGDVDVKRWGGACTAHIADVEVDTETGRVRVLRYTAVQDAGRAIHPQQVEGQIRGGVAQGVGWALYEGFSYDAEGHLLNANYLDYKMPTFLDLPPIETVIVEVPWPDHPYGVRGVGEPPIVPPPAAIANAICAATGARLTTLPMTPARLLEATGVLG